ncbi:MAG TPA: hypothetical protein DCP89_03285 [Acidimicrobiaceae bacterium]|nr:DUF3263 domain-containing protein [Actinomycetota bacterium]HAN07500.1 hypothetical protein [Acidimicrobiaceae bacterium]
MKNGNSNGLTEREKDILDFEQSWWSLSVPREQAVRDRFQLTETEYDELLEVLIATEAALEAEPLLVRRLRRMKDRRRQEHVARRTAAQEVK